MRNRRVKIKALRVAMLCLHSSPVGPLGTQDTGGMSVYVREVARWMAHAGHAVDIFTYGQSAQTLNVLYPNVRLIDLNPDQQETISKEGLVGHLSAAARALVHYTRHHQLRFDLIHSHYWLSGCVGVEVQEQWACPHLIMFHTLGLIKNQTTVGESEPDLRISHERRLIKSAHAIVVPSESERSHMLNAYAAPAEKLHTIPCGVNMERFKPMAKIQARTQLEIDPAATVLLFVGRFTPVKRMDVLLHALAQLSTRWTPIQLVVVGGDGPRAESTLAVTRQAERLGVTPLVRMSGRVDQDELPRYYNAADLVVVPSTYESFGLVTLESLACGTPVAATDLGGAAAVIKESLNGTLIEHSDGEAVARGIERVLTQVCGKVPDQQIRESVAGYGWDHIAASIMGLYETVLSDTRTK